MCFRRLGAGPFLAQNPAIAGDPTGRRLILELDMTDALRPSELFGLRWRDFNREDCLLELRETVFRESCATGERPGRRYARYISQKNWQMISGCGGRNRSIRNPST